MITGQNDYSFVGWVLILFCLAGCSSLSSSGEKALSDNALAKATFVDPSLKTALQDAYAYAIFPRVERLSSSTNSARSEGAVYQKGQLIGYAAIEQLSIGFHLSNQDYTELVLFENEKAFKTFEANQLKIPNDFNAIALNSGVSQSAQYRDGIIVFTMTIGGLMFEANLRGQTFLYSAL